MSQLFPAAEWSKTLFSFFAVKASTRNPSPDRRQNSPWLQINVGCNSTAICPRLQLLTASLRNPTSDSSSAQTPDHAGVSVRVLNPDRRRRGWICVVTASTDALIKYFSALVCPLSSENNVYNNKRKVFTWLTCRCACFTWLDRQPGGERSFFWELDVLSPLLKVRSWI